MFVQVIQGHTAEPSEVKASLDRWVSDLAPGSTGWLSSTAGVAEDGTCVIAACFESESAAGKNSERPEQHQWWMETAKLFAGEVSFLDCPEVMTYGEAPVPNARFVQFILGRVTDLARLIEVTRQSEPLLREARPDLLGYLAASERGGGRAAQVAYFTDEASARQGEGRELPAELQRLFEEEQSLFADIRYVDVRDPWIVVR